MNSGQYVRSNSSWNYLRTHADFDQNRALFETFSITLFKASYEDAKPTLQLELTDPQ